MLRKGLVFCPKPGQSSHVVGRRSALAAFPLRLKRSKRCNTPTLIGQTRLLTKPTDYHHGLITETTFLSNLTLHKGLSKKSGWIMCKLAGPKHPPSSHIAHFLHLRPLHLQSASSFPHQSIISVAQFFD